MSTFESFTGENNHYRLYANKSLAKVREGAGNDLTQLDPYQPNQRPQIRGSTERVS